MYVRNNNPDADPDDPRAYGQCDRCLYGTHRDALLKQFEYRGDALMWTGFLVCERCIDVPQQQNRTRRQQPDPPPVLDPRPYR